VLGAESGVMFCATIRVNYECKDNILLQKFAPAARVHDVNVQDVSGGIINILGGGSMDYSE
jgi:hypothetical protein